MDLRVKNKVRKIKIKNDIFKMKQLKLSHNIRGNLPIHQIT